MLLVRLTADLSAQPMDVLRKLQTFDLSPDPALLPDGPRLAVTYSWLEKQFGVTNAVRAVVETAAEILQQRLLDPSVENASF